MTHDPHRTMKPFETGVRQGQFHSLPGSAKTDPNVNRLLVSIRIVLEIVSWAHAEDLSRGGHGSADREISIRGYSKAPVPFRDGSGCSLAKNIPPKGLDQEIHERANLR